MTNTLQLAHVEFTASKGERKLITRIAKRAHKLAPDYAIMDAIMDIEATHCSGTPLCLEKLITADDFNFAHDVFGIRHHLNRTTGQLTGHFSPRSSLR